MGKGAFVSLHARTYGRMYASNALNRRRRTLSAERYVM